MQENRRTKQLHSRPKLGSILSMSPTGLCHHYWPDRLKFAFANCSPVGRFKYWGTMNCLKTWHPKRGGSAIQHMDSVTMYVHEGECTARRRSGAALIAQKLNAFCLRYLVVTLLPKYLSSVRPALKQCPRRASPSCSVGCISFSFECRGVLAAQRTKPWLVITRGRGDARVVLGEQRQI